MWDTLPLLQNESNSDFDTLITDVHGILYPGRCRLASYIGYIDETRTIGICENLIYGSLMVDQFI